MTVNEESAIERAITKHIGEGTVAMDEDGKITFSNPAALRLLGLEDVRQILGSEFHALVHGGGHCPGPDECALVQGMATGAEVQSHTDVFGRVDGSGLPVAYTLTWISEDGINSGAVVVFRNMSRFRNMQSRLLTTDRMTAMGTLASGVAHEMNNPLAYVKSNIRYVARILEERRSGEKFGPDDEALREALVDSLDGIARMESIIGGMRSFTDIEGEAVCVGIRNCLDDALAICGGWVRRYANLVVREEESLGTLEANTSRLTQVFVNLLINAAAAVEATECRGEVEVVLRCRGDERIIEFHDDGVGIDEGVCDQVYDPFFTTRETGQGMGLGLYISRCIIEELNGRITFCSPPEGGTVFRVIFPDEK